MYIDQEKKFVFSPVSFVLFSWLKHDKGIKIFKFIMTRACNPVSTCMYQSTQMPTTYKKELYICTYSILLGKSLLSVSLDSWSTRKEIFSYWIFKSIVFF